jgi:hypothetical protein
VDVVDLQPCAQPELPGELAREADQATDEVMVRILAEIPLYRALDPVQLADVRETVRAGYLATLELWAAGELAAPEQLESFRANGATRAAEGRPLPLVLRAYRVSGLGIYDYVVKHPAARLTAEEERNFARLTMTIVDQMSNEVTIGYVETTGQLSSQQGRARREFLEDLLAGRLLASAEVSERATTLGLALPRRPYLLVAAPSVGDGGSLIDRARVALQELGGAGLTLITRGQLVVIGESTDMQAIRRALETAGLTGVVLDVADLTDLAAAYQRAREVHDFMQTARLPGALTVGPDEALVLSILARARRDELVGRATAAILGPLADHAELLDTLDAYLLTGNAVSAAHRLGIHAQTMRYRLRRIREITGRDPAQGWDRFLLEFALRMT